MSAFNTEETSPKHKPSPFDVSSNEDGEHGPVRVLGSSSSGTDNIAADPVVLGVPGGRGGGLPQCMVTSPDISCCMSPFSQSQGSGPDGGVRMSKMNRLRMQMGLSIGDASTYQTHHRDEEHATPVDAAACEGMTQITDFMYLGSWRDSADSAASTLKSHGITHILNLAREHAAEGEPNRTNLHCLTIPMNDDHQEDLYERLLEAHNYINACHAQGGKVLVHCRRGISRSPAIVVSYLMKYNHMTYEEAYAFVAARRRVSLNLAFREFLSSWDPVLGKPPSSARRPTSAGLSSQSPYHSTSQSPSKPQQVHT